MEKLLLSALLVAVGSGIAVGIQGTLNNWAGRIIGPVHTGLLVSIAGGSVSFLLLLFVSRQQALPWAEVRASAPYVFGAGIMGIGILAGIAYSLPKAGIAAGLAGIILGQMLIAVVIDSLGWGGSKIPLNVTRLLGLLLLVIATLLILPRR